MYFYFIVSTFLPVLNIKFCSTSRYAGTFLKLNRENIFSKRLSVIDVIWQIEKISSIYRRKLADDSGVNYSEQTIFIWTLDNRGVYKCIDV